MNQCKVLNAWPIRRKMILLLLLIFLPASGILLSLGLENRKHEIMEARERALLLAQSLATQQEHIATGAKHMLSTLARMPEVQKLDAQACDKLFRELNELNPFYSVIAAATIDGMVFAGSTHFVPGTVNLADRKHLKDTIDTLSFSVGEYIVGRLSNVQALNYTYPVMDGDGKPVAVVTAGFRLNEFGSLMARANLSREHSVTISDHDGICLYRSPPNESAVVGKSISGDLFQHVSGDSEQGAFESTDENGVTWVHAFRQLRLAGDSSPYLHVIVSDTKEKILREVNFKMFRDLGLLFIAGLLALSLAWGYVNAAFIGPIKHMVAETQRFVKGDMSIRSGLPHTPDELGQLAKTLDDSASFLEKAHNELESKVAERTEKLARINEALKTEIAERRSAEVKLRESEMRFRQIAENIREVFWIAARDTSEILYVSPAYEEVWGQTRESLYADPHSWIAFIHPEDRERVLQNLNDRGDSEQTLEYRIIRPDGSIRWVLNRAFPVADQAGQVYRFAGFTEDITAEKSSHLALEAAHHKLMDIIEFLPDATFAIDNTGKVIAWNRAMEELTGVPKASMIGKGDHAYGIPFYGHPQPILIDLVIARSSETVEKYDSMERKGNKLYAEIYMPDFLGRGAHFWGVASPLLDVNGNIAGAIETLRDVSSRKALESSLLQRESELEEANTALRVLLKNGEDEQKKLHEQIHANLKEFVLPYLDKVRTDRLNQNQSTYLSLVESSLQEIFSPFLDNVTSAFKTLTPTEIQVANFIKDGKTGKQIADLLGIAYKTVETHRYNLRIKLGLQNEKVNLRSFLLSLK
jgi:PAS domain S-box-containing protein